MVFYGGGNAENLMEWVALTVFRLLWNLSIGVITGVLDFAIRLPFWIREYQNYPEEVHLPENYGDYDLEKIPKITEGEPQHTAQHNEMSLPYQTQEVSGGARIRWWLEALLFYTLALLGAFGGVFGLLLMIWSPFILIFGISFYQRERGERDGGLPRWQNIERNFRHQQQGHQD